MRFLTVLLFSASALAQMTVELAPSQSGPHRLGSPVGWEAKVSGAREGNVEFQFSGRRGDGAFRLLRSFHTSNRIIWAPYESDGSYTVRVIARDKSTGKTAAATSTFAAESLITNGTPVISATSHPLVALYSAPACSIGSSIYVQFTDGTTVNKTNPALCTPDSSMNFYVAGMLPSTTYSMNYVLVDADGEKAGPSQQFTTGVIDPTLPFPTLVQWQKPCAKTSNSQGILLMDYLSPPGGPYYFPTAMDLEGRVVWYYPQLGVASQGTRYFIRPVPQSQGHILLIANDPTAVPSKWQTLREIDLVGNTVNEISVSAVNAQLLAQGKLGIIDFDHEAIRLPNGHTLVLASQEKMYPVGTQGAATAVDILGNAIIDLDENWQVTWSWSAYDHMDIGRAAILGETCQGQAGCPTLTLATKANDWLHSNSLQYLPDTGSVIMSVRHQDWVIKIDYADGAGSGNVIWRLGNNGDFTITSDDTAPWFSHQHDAQLFTDTGLFIAFDNGNTRITNAGGVGGSRGYALQVDEANRAVSTTLLADLGAYSIAVGSAQLLNNGNIHFEAGFIPMPSTHSYSVEVERGGSLTYDLEVLLQVYRSYRMASLYSLN